MQITGKTKISELINANDACIGAIAGVNKHFEKLKNPVLRKLFAPRVTISDVARIGGCTVFDLFEVLRPLGFEVEKEASDDLNHSQKNSTDLAPFIFNHPLMYFDVRPILKSGKDPFTQIIKNLAALPPENIMCIINSFEPTPLMRILEKKGFEFFMDTQGSEEIHLYIKKPIRANNKDIENLTQSFSKEDLSFDKLVKLFEGNIISIDVRDLEMPQPMLLILKELETLKHNNALLVHHKKVPVFLLPELQEKGFKYSLNEISEGNVKLIIYK